MTSSAQTLAASCLFVAEWTAVTNTYGGCGKRLQKEKEKLKVKASIQAVFVYSNAKREETMTAMTKSMVMRTSAVQVRYKSLYISFQPIFLKGIFLGGV